MNAAPINAAQIIADSYAILQRGDPRAAEMALARLWNAGPPPPPRAMHLLGLIRSAQGRTGDAELLMRQSIDADPTNAEYHNNLGGLLRDAGFPDHALAIFAEAVRHGPKLAPARLNLVRALAAAGRLDEAETHARTLVRQRPDAAALTVLGAVLRDQRRGDEARAAFDAALALEPLSVNTRLQSAIALDRVGRGEEAVALFAALHGEGARGEDLYGAWASALMDLRRAADAETRLVDAIARHPASVALQTSLAKVRWLRGDTTGFARDFETAVRARPDNVALRVGCADILRRGERRDDALALMRAGLARAPDDAAMLAMFGALCMDAGDIATALPALERAYAGRPHDWTLRHVLADTLLQADRPDDALAHISAGRTAWPTASHWLALEAVALRMRGDPAYATLYDFDAMVRVYDLPAPEGYASMSAFNAALAESLRALHTLGAHPLDQSLRHGTQTAQSLLESNDPAIVAFLRLADAALGDYVAAMPDDAAHPVWSRKPASGRARMVECWSVRLKPGGFHINHVHSEGWISSAYYVAVPPGVAGAGDHQGWIQFGAPRWPMPGITAERFVEPRVGRLVLFPSCMWHGTVPFRDGDERLSIAFDAIPDARA